MKYWNIENGNVVFGESYSGGGWFIEVLAATNTFQLYEIPQHGGKPQHIKTFDNATDAVAAAKNLT